MTQEGVSGLMKVYGHRGASAVAPENTLAAFGRALADGADGVECDLRLTADGALVVIHDADVSRATGGRGLVHEMTLAEIRGLDAGAAFGAGGRSPRGGRRLRVPMLEEVWAVTRGRLIIEVKPPAWIPGSIGPTVERLIGFLRRRDCSAVAVSSFDVGGLSPLREALPHVRTGVLTVPGVEADTNLDAAVAGGHEICFLPNAQADSRVVTRAHGLGRTVIVWTVDEPERLRALAGIGIDGVITNDPAGARAALAG